MDKMNQRSRASNQKLLETTLGELKERFNYGHNLSLRWEPRVDRGLDGEVRGNTILVYVIDIESAVKTVKHEFLEYLLDPHTKELQGVINLQREIINHFLGEGQKKASREREKVVETILGGLDPE